MKKILMLIICLYLSACSTHLADLSVVSNKNVEIDKVNLDKLPQTRNVVGQDKKFVLFVIPLGSPQLKEAVNDAMRKANGDLMINVSVYQKSWWFIVGQTWIEVDGTVVNTKGGK